MAHSPPGSSVHGMDSPGKNTGVGCHFLLWGIFPVSLALEGAFFYHWAPHKPLHYNKVVIHEGDLEKPTIENKKD